MEAQKHTINFFTYNDARLARAEQTSNCVACFPSFVAQKIAGLGHSAFGTMQAAFGVMTVWSATSELAKMKVEDTKMGWKDVKLKVSLHQNATLAPEDQEALLKLKAERKADRNEKKRERDSGLGHLIDGCENMVRGSTEWALGKYAQRMRNHFPGSLKRFPGALGGVVLVAVNVLFPHKPFEQINRSWKT